MGEKAGAFANVFQKWSGRCLALSRGNANKSVMLLLNINSIEFI